MEVVGLVTVALCVGLTAVGAQPGGSAVNVQGVWRVVSNHRRHRESRRRAFGMEWK